MILQARIILGLGLALSLSLGANYVQWSSRIAAAAAHKAEVLALTAQAEAAATASALEYSRGFAAAAATEARRIDARLEEIAAQQEQTQAEYLRRLRSIPPLSLGCAPGQPRIDAFNSWE